VWNPRHHRTTINDLEKIEEGHKGRKKLTDTFTRQRQPWRKMKLQGKSPNQLKEDGETRGKPTGKKLEVRLTRTKAVVLLMPSVLTLCARCYIVEVPGVLMIFNERRGESYETCEQVRPETTAVKKTPWGEEEREVRNLIGGGGNMKKSLHDGPGGDSETSLKETRTKGKSMRTRATRVLAVTSFAKLQGPGCPSFQTGIPRKRDTEKENEWEKKKTEVVPVQDLRKGRKEEIRGKRDRDPWPKSG